MSIPSAWSQVLAFFPTPPVIEPLPGQLSSDARPLPADAIFKLVADRSPDEGGLASQPTLSRFMNAIFIPSLKRVRDVFLDQFIASFDTASN
jgi:hypothetical protein